MKESAVEVIKKGLRAFSPVIRYAASSDPLAAVEKAISEDPKIIYYLKSYTVSTSPYGSELKAQYIHKDTDRSDIQMVSSRNECVELMCHFVGQYRRKLIVIIKCKVNCDGVIDDFSEKHGSFYPNLTSISSTRYGLNKAFSIYEFDFKYRIGRVKLAMMEQEVDAAVERIAKALFVPNISNAAKIYLVHNYLAYTVKYVNSNDNRLDTSYTQSAYGALIRKQCVCQGYAEAFKRLMDYGGINCTVIYGQISGSSGLHAWNIVSLDKNSSFYHIDVTWDAGDKPKYNYFCKNDSFFKGDRSWNTEYNPRCSGSYPVLAVARRTVMLNKAKLLANGVAPEILDC